MRHVESYPIGPISPNSSVRVLQAVAIACASLLLRPEGADTQPRAFDYRGDTAPVAAAIDLTLTAGTPEFERDEAGQTTVVMRGFAAGTSPGDPALPHAVYDVAVPPNVDPGTVRLQFEPQLSPIEGDYTIPPVPPLRARVGDQELIDWGPGKQIVNGRNMRVYGADTFFPADPVDVAAEAQMRKWRFVSIAFTPVQYNPGTGQLRLVKSVKVRLSFTRIGRTVFRTDPLLNDVLMDVEARQRFVNLEAAQEWYRPLAGPVGPAPTTHDYVIITTNATVTGSGTGLTDFVNHKTALGHSVRVVTETDYGSLTGQAPNGTAERIRQWLIDNYSTLGIKWVLLIGDPDPDDPGDATDTVGDVPMKMCWPRLNATSYPQYDESPTDYFYADLTGNWDVNGDGYFGDPAADGGATGVDFTPEVYVGRIPVYGSDYTALNGILQKIITYETAPSIPEWRRKWLFASVYLWDPDSDYKLGEAVKADLADPLGFSTYRCYESDFGLVPPPECPAINTPNADSAAPCNMLQQLVHGGGYGVLAWSTHGGTDSASDLIGSTDCGLLSDSEPFFTFQGSCLNGYPEDPDNLGYSLLHQGAIATVSASRVSWNSCFDPAGDPNPSSGRNCNLTYHYLMRVMNGLPCGQALYRTKDEVSSGSSWMNKMDYNVYGDPSSCLLRPYVVGDVDVVMVLDHSGSMSGYTSTSMTDQKIEVLRYAANHFLDMMTTDAGHQLGVVKFSTTASTDMNLQPFTAASQGSAHTLINAIGATSLTSIGDGLSHAVTGFTSHGAVGHRRLVLLVTDGMENTAPMIADVKASVISNDITVFPLGLGYSYGIDETKLTDLANDTGGDYRITDNDLIFRKYFIEMLGSAVDWTVVTDPILTLSAGEAASVPVNISSTDSEVLFTAYWSDFDNAIELTLQSPGGTAIAPGAPTYIGRERYSLYRIDLQGVAPADRTGTWQMKLAASPDLPDGQQVRVSASAFVRTSAKMTAALDNSVIRAGEPALLRVVLTEGGQPLKGAKVVASCERPLKGFGKVMHDYPVDLREVRVERRRGEPYRPLDLKILHLQRKLGPDFMPRRAAALPLFDDGRHRDGGPDDGVYANTFADTRVPGLYDFHIRASGTLSDGTPMTREWTTCLRSAVDPDLKATEVDIQPVGRALPRPGWRVTVVPRDRLGNYLGPGHRIAIVTSARGAKHVLELTDELDASYSKEIVPIGGRPPTDFVIDDWRFAIENRKFAIQIDGELLGIR